MRTDAGPVGRRGLAVLAVAGALGVILAVHGWSARNTGLPHAGIGVSSSRPARQAAATPSVTHPAAGPHRPPVSKRPQVGKRSPVSKLPQLSKQPYANVAYQIWPGTPSAAAKAALTGLSVSVKREGSALMVTADVNGQPAQPARRYAGGARVYVVESTLGDDSGNTDYNLGDDALVVTDAHGGILR